MSFYIFGTKVNISFFFFAMITVFLLYDNVGMFPFMFWGIILHEASHIFAFITLGKKLNEINFSAFGIDILTNELSTSICGGIYIHMMGPLANLAAAYIALHFLHNDYMSAANLILGLFHLLPIRGLDGGNVLGLILTSKFGSYSGEKALLVISYTAISLLSLFAIFLFLKNGNLSLLCLCIILMFYTKT